MYSIKILKNFLTLMDATTLSKMTLSITTHRRMTFSIMTLGKKTLRMMTLTSGLSVEQQSA